MSKGSDSPAAFSFENPHKTGWLLKHGGSGVSSHWKKRWFIVEKNYMFYYKGPNDKKPVGILCLLDYQSCHKASNKESKKANSFVLDRGSSHSESTDSGPTKNYILCTDSEEDMESWVAAITTEMPPSLEGGLYNRTPPSQPKIDSKVFDEVTAIVCETPKLTHLTASRPKMKGRRPPKKYSVFHEDDSKDNDSPPNTSPMTSPLVSKRLPETPETSPSSSPMVAEKKGNRILAPTKFPLTPPKKPKISKEQDSPPNTSPMTSPLVSKRLPETPKASPSSSPMVAEKKGNRPSSPTKFPLTPPKKPKISKEQEESVSTSPRPPTKPVPPKKPIARDRHGSIETSIDDGISMEIRTPHKPLTKPVPPRKPTPISISEPSEIVAVSKLANGMKPVPIARPRPTTSRTKPQSNNVSGVITKQASHEEPAEPITPVKKPRPIPMSRKTDAVKVECVSKVSDAEEEQKHGKEETKLPDKDEAKLPDKEEDKLPDKEEDKLPDKEAKLPDEEEDKLPDKEEDKLPDEEEDKLPDEEEDKLPDEEEDKLPDKEEEKLPDKEEDKLPDEEEDKLSDKEEDKLPDEEEDKLSDKEEDKLPDEEDKLPDKEEDKLPDKEEDKLPDNGVILEASAYGEQQESVDDTDSAATTQEGERKEEELERQVDEKESKNGSFDEDRLEIGTSYENVIVSYNKDDQESEKNMTDETYEDMTYDSLEGFRGLNMKVVENDLNMSSNVNISLAAHTIEAKSTHQPAPDGINPDNLCIGKVEGPLNNQRDNFNMPTDQREPEIDNSACLNQGDLTSSDSLECPIYDVPRPVMPASMEDDYKSTSMASDIDQPLSSKVRTKSYNITSSNSTSLKELDEARKGCKEGAKTLPHNMNIVTMTDISLERQSNLVDGSIKQVDTGDEEDLDSPHSCENESESVSKVLQQAKEILRQAKSAKVEAYQIREESSRELELARRERHDASLLKKNAAEILKIAKTKLTGKH